MIHPSSQNSPRFLTQEIVEDLNKNLEEGKAQLEQLVDSDELQNAATEASQELKQVLESGAVQTGAKMKAKDIKLDGLKKKVWFSIRYKHSRI